MTQPLPTFADPWNPSSSEVRAWAYAPNPDAPCEDWDLALSWAGHERDYLEFAADAGCPNQAYFLHALYFMVGSAVRSEFRSVPRPVVQGFIDRTADTGNQQLQLWRERSIRLLKNPNEFKYAAWCGGGLAKNNAEA
jgi:hypothetical protein